MMGRVVETLVNETKESGRYEIVWNASRFASGMYFYQIEATGLDNSNNRFIETKKMILIK
jgi:hypothetical protein